MNQSQEQRHHFDLHLLGGGGVAHGPSRRHRGHRRLHRLPGEQDGEQHGEQHGLIDLLLGLAWKVSCTIMCIQSFAKMGSDPSATIKVEKNSNPLLKTISVQDNQNRTPGNFPSCDPIINTCHYIFKITSVPISSQVVFVQREFS